MVRVALIGTGAIAVQNHLPGIKTHPEGEVVALCDPNPEALDRAARASGVTRTYAEYRQALAEPDVDAVVIATPNNTHRPIALAAAQMGKHVLCEKPIGMDHGEALAMLAAATQAGIVHMTAFTYRFVPAMRYLRHLIERGDAGALYHFRVNRLQDWGDTAVGWRQVKAIAGSGELGDMLSHRIDYAHYLIGPIIRLVAQTKQYLKMRRGPDGAMHPSDVDDWVAFLGEFADGTTGVFESTKLATGRGSGGQSQDYVEINGSGGTFIYHLSDPHHLQIGRPGGHLDRVAVPEEFLKVKGSPRDARAGDPLQGFRFDQSFEFVQAIVDKRSASPDFRDGARAQAVMDAVLQSAAQKQWVSVPGAEVA